MYFKFHRSLMLTVLLLTFLSFLLILLEMRFMWSTGNMEFVHSVLGIIVICLVCINVRESNLFNFRLILIIFYIEADTGLLPTKTRH